MKSHTKNIASYFRGILLTSLLASLSLALSRLSFIQYLHLSPLIIGILLGIMLSFFYQKQTQTYHLGVNFSSKRILRFGIILYGFFISFADMKLVGLTGIILCIIVVVSVLTLGIILGIKVFKLDKDLAILVSCGSAICGAAAILAAESALKGESHKGIIAVGTIVIFGLIGMLVYPLIYPFLPFTEMQEGFYIGLSLHEVANVVGAGESISRECASFALIIKMIRVILLVPVLLIIPLLFSSHNKTKTTIQIPWFALLFLLVIIIHSTLSLPPLLIKSFTFLSIFCLTMAMSALGLQIDFKKFTHLGKGALKLAFVLFLFLAIFAFILVYLAF